MNFATFINFLHLLAMATWVGGMLYLNIVLMPSLSSIDPSQRGRLMGTATKRFSLLAWGSVIVLVTTGLFRAPHQAFFNFSIVYGILLTIKILIVFSMIVIGGLMSFVLGPKMIEISPPPGEAPDPEFLKVNNQLALLSRINMLLGVLVLVFAASLS